MEGRHETRSATRVRQDRKVLVFRVARQPGFPLS